MESKLTSSDTNIKAC